MRIYHFLPAVHALEDIQKKRIKISEIDQLNDPFELWCVSQENKRFRPALRKYKKDMGERFGLICFSKGWFKTFKVVKNKKGFLATSRS